MGGPCSLRSAAGIGAVAFLGAALDQASVLTEPGDHLHRPCPVPHPLLSHGHAQTLPPTHDPAAVQRVRGPGTQAGSVAAAPRLAPSLCVPLSRGDPGAKAAASWGPPWGSSAQLARFLPQRRGEQGSGGDGVEEL